MKENSINPYIAHKEILLALPWYVNKTLRDPEIKAVENHLKVCLICRREIAMLQKLSLAVNKADSIETAAQVSFSRLKKRIHQTEKLALPFLSNKTPRPRQLKWYQKLGVDYFNLPQTAVALIAVLLFSVLVPWYYVAGNMQKSDFRTLSNGENSAINNNEIKVIFQKDITEQQKNKILDSVHGQIASGPTTEGVYLIRLSYKPQAETILATLSSLRKNSSVIFAEPAYDLLSSSQPGGAIK